MVCLSRPYHLIFFKDYFSQNLLSPLLSTLSHMCRKNMLGQFWSGNTSKEVWCVLSKYHEAIWNSEKNLFLGLESHGATPPPGLDIFNIVAPDFYKSTLPIKKQLETFGFFYLLPKQESRISFSMYFDRKILERGFRSFK